MSRVEQLQRRVRQQAQQIETQSETIKQLWVKDVRKQKIIDHLRSLLERATSRKPTMEEIRDAVFGGQGNGQG